jgi:beta-N-acetylhexosaminidase
MVSKVLTNAIDLAAALSEEVTPVRLVPTLLSLTAIALGSVPMADASPRATSPMSLFAAGEDNAPPGDQRAAPEPPPLPRQRPSPPQKNDQALRSMIGQMIIIGFPGASRGDNWSARAAEMVQEGKIGGVILFSENVIEPRQVKQLTSSFVRKPNSPPAFICVDQEGGTIQRLPPGKGFVGLPSAQRIAAMEPAVASQLYRRAAQELISLGINCNFGPVVDLNIEPNNPAIGRLGRSYDRNPQKVVAYARLFIEAHRQAGVLTAAKHFPGHGSARSDPHDQVVNIARTWQDVELDPFRALVNDVDMIMVGHLMHPRFSDGDRPASLSRAAIQNVLRAQLNFRGLVVSDDLDMGAIRTRYGVAEAAVMAVEAGSDLLIVANTRVPDPAIADRIIAAVAQAVSEGRISREAIEESYRRILQAKKKIVDRRAYVLQ